MGIVRRQLAANFSYSAFRARTSRHNRGVKERGCFLARKIRISFQLRKKCVLDLQRGFIFTILLAQNLEETTMLVSQQQPTNERRFRRYQLIYRLSVFDNYNQQLIGYIIDLSLGGALLITDRAIKNKAKMKIHIELPSTFLDEKYIDIYTEVIRINRDINPDYFCVGIRFLDLNYKDQIVIESIIENYSF